jgi:glutathione S-transferase
MSKPKLIYFDAPVSRGEECRLALHIAGVEFIDERIQRDQWPALKPRTPYGSVPVLEIPGRAPLGQSNAILVLIGRVHGLLPADPFESARHEGLMQHVEDLRAQLSPTLRMGEAEKKAAREALAADYIPRWAEAAERNIGAGPFVGGSSISVADLKLYMIVRWLSSGTLDHIPATIFANYPRLVGVHDAVRDHARVKDWYARK